MRYSATFATVVIALGLGACMHRKPAAGPVGETTVVTSSGGARKTVEQTPPGGPRTRGAMAPDFITVGPGQRAIPSKQFRGQPVVILVAPSPDSGALRKEAERIEKLYLDLSARKTIFVSAFTAQLGRVPSNVPYILAQNGTAIANAYGVVGAEFAVIVIGVDGHVDMVSTKVESAQRILDVINNNGSIQAANRVGLGS